MSVSASSPSSARAAATSSPSPPNPSPTLAKRSDAEKRSQASWSPALRPEARTDSSASSRNSSSSSSLRAAPTIRNRSGINPTRIKWYIPGSSLRLARSPVAPKRTITWSFGVGIACCCRDVITVSLCCFPMPPRANRDLRYDPAALDRVERRFWRDIWQSMPHEAASEHGVELRRFGALQATLTRDLPQVPILNLVLGAPEASEADLDY